MKLNITSGTFNGDFKVDASVRPKMPKVSSLFPAVHSPTQAYWKYMATNATVDIKLLSNINIAKTGLPRATY